MTLAQFLFYSFGSVIIISSILAVTNRRILRAAVFLLFALGSTAGIYFMLGFLFLAAVQIIVYAGGIVVLIIFSILLTSNIGDRLPGIGLSKTLISLLAVAVGLALSLVTILGYSFPVQSSLWIPVEMADIGKRLLSYGNDGYVLPFEVISILLLAAMVTAIIIAKSTKPKTDD